MDGSSKVLQKLPNLYGDSVMQPANNQAVATELYAGVCLKGLPLQQLPEYSLTPGLLAA